MLERVLLVVKLVVIGRVNLGPARLLDEVNVDDTSGVSITMDGMVNRAATQFNGFLLGQVPLVTSIENSVSESRSRTDGEDVAFNTSSIVVDVVKMRSRLIPASNHGTHGQTASTVGVDDVGKDLGGGSNRDTLSVTQLKEAAAASQFALPERAISSSSSHSSEQVGVDLNDLLYGL